MATLSNTTPPSGNVDGTVIDLTQDDDSPPEIPSRGSYRMRARSPLGSPSGGSYWMRARNPLNHDCYEGVEFISLDALFGQIEGMAVNCNMRSDDGQAFDAGVVTKQNQQEASPSELASGTHTKVSSMGPICAICLEELSNKGSGVSSTTCGHLFCTKCLQDAFKVYRSCPKCRKKVTARGFRRVFF